MVTLSQESQKLLAMMAANGVPPFGSGSMEQAREAYAQVGMRLGGTVVEMASVENLTMPGPAGTLPLRIYRPDTDVGTKAALVYYHGGGWVMGGLETHDKVCRQIAHRAGCAVVSVGYRLAPEYPMPAGADDAAAAVHWIANNAAPLNLSAEKLGVGGDSAGGSLAAYAALAARDEGIPLRCQILAYPSTDHRASAWEYPSRNENGDVPPLTREAMQNLGKHLNYDAARANDRRVSPIIATQSSRSAPALILTAGADALRDDGLFYAQRLLSAGSEVLLRDFPGTIHGFIEMSGVLKASIEAHETIAFFLKQRLVY